MIKFDGQYIYYNSDLDQIFLTTYHWGLGTTVLPSAFDGVEVKTLNCEFPVLFDYVGKL